MKNLIITLMSVGFLNLTAQSIEKQIIGSAGGTTSAGNIILSATVGETNIETKTGTFTLTEGYHQGNENTKTSVDNFDVEISYSLYPNPSTDIVNINLNASEFISANLIIYNAIGEKVLGRKEISGQEIQSQFNISKLNTGIYYLNIIFNDGTIRVISFQKN